MIEIRNAGVIRPADMRALQEFAGDYPECEPVLLYRGSDGLEVCGIRCMPVIEFLEKCAWNSGSALSIRRAPLGTPRLSTTPQQRLSFHARAASCNPYPTRVRHQFRSC